MTYIIGIKKYGITTIIGDAQVSLIKNGRVEKHSLAQKIGRLFKGCAYGAAGDQESILSFITGWDYCSSRYDYDEDNREIPWVMFKTFLETFPFNERYPFEMIISSYASGKPNLFLLDSRTAPLLKEIREDIVTIGSGKDILDERLFEFHKKYADSFCRAIFKEKEIWHCYPYVYCSWLMARIQGYDALELEKYGVGGYFYFNIQTKDGVAVQSPAIYVLYTMTPNFKEAREDANGKLYIPMEIIPSIHRIGFIRRGNLLVIESSPTPFDPTSTYYIYNLWSQEEMLEEFGKGEPDLNNVYQKATEAYNPEFKALPLYTYCGFVFADPKFEIFIEYHLKADGAKESVITQKDNQWTISAERIKYVEDYFTKSLNEHRKNPDALEIRVAHYPNQLKFVEVD